VLIVYQVLQIELESDIKKWFAGKVLGEISSRGASSVEDIMATPDFESFLKKLVVEWIERSFASFDVVRFGELPDTKRFVERFVTKRFIEPLCAAQRNRGVNIRWLWVIFINFCLILKITCELATRRTDELCSTQSTIVI
jgi:hypothetical protein